VVATLINEVSPVSTYVKWTNHKSQYVTAVSGIKTIELTYEGTIYNYVNGVLSVTNLAPNRQTYDFKV